MNKIKEWLNKRDEEGLSNGDGIAMLLYYVLAFGFVISIGLIIR